MTDFATLVLASDTRGLVTGERALDSLTATGARTERAVNAQAGSMKRAIASFAGAAAGSLAGLAAGYVSIQAASAAVTAARGFNAAIAETSTLIKGTPQELDELAASARGMARAYGTDGTSQVKAFYQAISAGAGSVTEAAAVLDAANKLAIGGVTDVTTATDILTTATNVYAASGLTSAQASDALFVAMKAGKTTIGELASSLGAVLPLAEKMGVTFDETAATTAALTKGGISTSVAVTGLRAALTAVLGPSAEAKKLAAELGIEFTTAAVEAKGFSGFMADVVVATGGSSEAMSTLFGSVEATTVALALSGEAGRSLGSILDDMAAKAGATDEAFGKMANGADERWNRAVSAASDIGLTFGNGLLAVIVPALEAGAGAMALAGENMDVLAALTASYVATQIPALAAGMLTASRAMTTYLMSVEAALIGTVALNRAISAIPVVAVAAAGVAVYRAYTSQAEAAEASMEAQKALNEAMGVFAETHAPSAREAALSIARANLVEAESVLQKIDAYKAQLESVQPNLPPHLQAEQQVTIDQLAESIRGPQQAVENLRRTISAMMSETVVTASESAEEVATLTASFDALDDAVSSLGGSAVRGLSDMAADAGRLAEQIDTAERASRDLASAQQGDAIRNAVLAAADLVGQLDMAAGVSDQLEESLRAAASDETFSGVAVRLADIVDLMDMATGGASEMEGETRQVYAALADALGAAISLAQLDMAGGIAAAADEAARLAMNMQMARAVRNIAMMGNMSDEDAAMSQEVIPSIGAVASKRDELTSWLKPPKVGRGGGSRKSSGGGGAEELDDYARALKATRDAIRDIGIEEKALHDLASSGRDVGDALDFARKKSELMRAAMEAGKQITPQLEAEIDKLAEAYTRAGEQIETTKDAMNEVADRADRAAEHTGGMFASIIDGSLKGKDAINQLLAQMGKVAIINSFKGFAKSGAGGGFFAGLGKALGFSDGGYTGDIGEDQPAGIVHGREYVVRAEAVRRPGVRTMLEAMNAGFPASIIAPPMPSGGKQVGSIGGGEININITTDPAAIVRIAGNTTGAHIKVNNTDRDRAMTGKVNAIRAQKHERMR